MSEKNLQKPPENKTYPNQRPWVTPKLIHLHVSATKAGTVSTTINEGGMTINGAGTYSLTS